MNLWFDLKYAWRLLLKTPGYTTLCVVIVALSVGLPLWSYSLAYAMVLKPLPFPAERWYSVQIAANATATPSANVDAYTYQELLRRNRTAKHLGAFANRPAVLSEGQASTSLRAVPISPSLLAAMSVTPMMGRLFDEADSKPGATPVAIVSYLTWKNYFVSDPAIVGREVRIDARPVRIVGVLPESFFGFDDDELWLPLQMPNLTKPGDLELSLVPFVVPGPGQQATELAAEMTAAVKDVNESYPAIFNAGRHVALIPAARTFTHQNFQIVTMVVFIALSVLLLGCLNISMIFLARLLERTRELALRTAVGASRSRLLRQSLLETALVVVLGLVVAAGLASIGVRWMQSVDAFGAAIRATGRSSNLPVLRPIDYLTGVVAALVLWLLSTLIPAWRVSRQDAALVLAGSGKGVAGPGGAKSAALLVAVQVTISSLVLVICANLVLAIREEHARPTGVDSTRVTISTYPTVFDPRYDDPNERLRYWDELKAAIQGRIRNAEVAYATTVPTRSASVPIAIEHQEGNAKQGTLTSPVAVVSDDYFPLLKIARRSGRLFDATDTITSLPVALVDENAALRHWPGQNAIGKRIQLDPAKDGPWLTVVGIVSNVTRPYRRNAGVVYRPMRQALPAEFHLVTRLPAASADHRVALRAAAFAVDRDLPLHNLQTLDDYLAALNLGWTAMVPAFSVISVITLILAATGLYGLISRSVAQRTQEVGVRRAVGGTQWQVTAVFLRQGALYMSIAIAGIALGVMATNWITRSVPNILARVAPATTGVFAVLALVIFAASYLPTRRAVALEPGDALHYE
jgi:putative ABC transport system permease protein